jgi:hypothetical protein
MSRIANGRRAAVFLKDEVFAKDEVFEKKYEVVKI